MRKRVMSEVRSYRWRPSTDDCRPTGGTGGAEARYCRRYGRGLARLEHSHLGLASRCPVPIRQPAASGDPW